MKNEPSYKEYTHPARYDLYQLRELGSAQCVLTHYNFLEDSTESCILLDYDLSGANSRCLIMGPNGRETVSRLSLYLKKEDVPPMAVNMPWLINRVEIDRKARVETRQLAAMEDDYTVYDKPNLKVSTGNPVYWIWWTIGATILVGAITLWSKI